MLTRIEVDGFKNLVDFSLELGPYTCIAGVNGVGKSNIFDAIRFLSLLTDHTINQSALLIRSSEQDTGEIADLFFSANGNTVNRIRFAAEMIVDRTSRGRLWPARDPIINVPEVRGCVPTRSTIPVCRTSRRTRSGARRPSPHPLGPSRRETAIPAHQAEVSEQRYL